MALFDKPTRKITYEEYLRDFQQDQLNRLNGRPHTSLIGGAINEMGGAHGLGALSETPLSREQYEAQTPAPQPKNPINSPVVHNGTPIPDAEGLNFLKRGPAEQQWEDAKAKYNAGPTRTDAYADAMLKKYGEGFPGVSNRADEAYKQFLSSAPADLNPYYTNAKRMASEDIDKRLSARGLYGSSAADDAIREAMTNLSAEQANREADYGLRRSALGGQLGSAADVSSRGASESERAWLDALRGVASGADTADLNYLNSGMTAAGEAQGAQTTRGQNMIHNALDLGDRFSGLMGDSYDKTIQGDQGLMSDAQNMRLGNATEQANQASQDYARNAATWNDTLGSVVSAAPTVGKSFENHNPQQHPVRPVSYSESASYQYPYTSNPSDWGW